MTEFNLANIANSAAEYAANNQINYVLTEISGEQPVIRVEVEDREELPVFLSLAEDELLAMIYLFSDDEIKADSFDKLHEAMLLMNIPLPLSSFGKVGDRYVIFGSLAASSSANIIAQEIETLVDNAMEAISELDDYLK